MKPDFKKKTGLQNEQDATELHFGVEVEELIKCKCGGIVRNQIW